VTLPSLNDVDGARERRCCSGALPSVARLPSARSGRGRTPRSRRSIGHQPGQSMPADFGTNLPTQLPRRAERSVSLVRPVAGAKPDVIVEDPSTVAAVEDEDPVEARPALGAPPIAERLPSCEVPGRGRDHPDAVGGEDDAERGREFRGAVGDQERAFTARAMTVALGSPTATRYCARLNQASEGFPEPRSSSVGLCERGRFGLLLAQRRVRCTTARNGSTAVPSG
jgi:hypothetical protein